MDCQKKENSNIQLEEIKTDYKAIAEKNSQFSQGLNQYSKYQADISDQMKWKSNKKVYSIEKQNTDNNLQEIIQEAKIYQNQQIPQTQNRNFITRNYHFNTSNSLNNQNQQSRNQKNSFIDSINKYIFLFIFLTIIISLDLSFGILFQKSLNDGENYDNCENKTLLKWALYTYLLSFTRAGLLFVLGLYYLSQFKMRNQNCGIGFQFIFLLCYFLFSLASTGLYYCFQGLQYSNSSDCGQLYKVTKAYIIAIYTLSGIIILILGIFCLYFLALKLRR